MKLGFKRLSENSVIPTKANPTDSGWDLYAAEDAVIAPGETVVINTDIALQLPKGFGATVRPRSGITSKTKLRVQLGTIDNAYTGNVGIILDNTSIDNGGYRTLANISDTRTGHNLVYKVGKGDKLAQLVLERIYAAELMEVFELKETERGENGFGSSGTKYKGGSY